MPQSQFDLINQFLNGAIDRRSFIRKAVGLGLAAPVVASTLAMMPRNAFAQGATLPSPTAPREAGTPAADDQQVLTMVTPSPFRMDPPTYGGDLWQLQMMVYQALTRMTLDEEIGPGVADTWESNADATVWTFHLNPNAMFSDGTPITADDVIWTWSWITSPASKSTSPDNFKWVVGYEDVKSGAAETLSGMKAIDANTLEITTSSPYPAMPALASTFPGCVLKKDNVISGGEEWWRAPVTSGIYKVTEYTPGDQATMTLERNEHWWREPSKLAKIQFSLVADPQTQLVQFDNGEISGMVCQPAEFAEATKPGGKRADDLFWGYAAATWFFAFICNKAPFDDADVRRALAQAVDVNVISSAVLNGIYPPEPRLLPAQFCGGDEQFQPTFDVEAAKASLAASKYPDAGAVGKVTFLISEQGGATALGTWGKVATAIGQMLTDNLGLEVDLIRKVFASVQDIHDTAQQAPAGAIFRSSLGASMPDPSYISGIVQSESSGNIAQYNNPEVDQLIAQGDAEADPAKRCEIYSQVDELVSKDALFLAPFRGTSTWFFQPNVRGLKIVNQRIWNAIDQVYIAQ